MVEQDENVELNVDASQEDRPDANYSAKDLQVLEGLEAVRKRPGMYIGTTAAAGLHHLVWEIVDNSIDEALAGFCDKIIVKINKGDTITVIDNGRGNDEARNIGEQELGREEKDEVLDVIDIAVDNIIQNENEEKQQYANGRNREGGAKLLQSRLAVHMLVIADKSVQQHPVDGQEDDAHVEFRVIKDALGKMAEQGVVNIVFSVYEKQYPCCNGCQNVEEDVEKSQSAFVHGYSLVDIDHFDVVEIEMGVVGVGFVLHTRYDNLVILGIEKTAANALCQINVNLLPLVGGAYVHQGVMEHHGRSRLVGQ